MFTDVGVQRWDVFLREENSPGGNHLAPQRYSSLRGWQLRETSGILSHSRLALTNLAFPEYCMFYVTEDGLRN